MMKNIKYISSILLIVLFSTQAVAQSWLKRKVTNEDGKPVVGAIITDVNKPSTKMCTDSAGCFNDSIQVERFVRIEDNQFLKNVLLTKKNIDIQLKNTAKKVEYGQWLAFNQEESTASSYSVSGDKLLKRSNLNPVNALYGLLPGLTVLQNGGYGGYGETNPTMFIRGVGTMNSNAILVIVDGFERPLNSLVTEEIETVTVLKDAAALALYGQKGANGVLLVKTKKGTANQVQIDVSYQHTFTTPFRLPQFVDAATYAAAYNEGLINEGLPKRYSTEEIAAYANGNYPTLFPNVDWMRETIRDIGHRDQLNLSAKGGTDRVRYFTLINYAGDKGLIKNANDNEGYSTNLSSSTVSARTNLDVDLTKSTSFDVHVLAKLRNTNRPSGVGENEIFETIYGLPANTYPVKTDKGIWGGESDAFPKNPVALTSATGYAPAHGRGMYTDMGIKQNLDMFIDGVAIEARIGFDAYVDYWDGRGKDYLRESNVAHLSSQGLGEITTTQYGKADKALGFWSSVGTQERHSNLMGRVLYDKVLNSAKLNSSLIFKQDRKVQLGQYRSYTHQDIIGHLHYLLRDKYVVDLALTYAGSSLLPKENRREWYPAISTGWNINKESFMQGLEWMDFMKIRASYGIAGNDNVEKILMQHPFVSGPGFIFKDEFIYNGGMLEAYLPSSKLTSEKSYKANLGIDGSFLNCLDINVDVFYNQTRNILVSPLSVTSWILGVSGSLLSEGKVDNYGLELNLNLHEVVGDFKYTIGAQFSFSRNKIIDMNEGYVPYDYLRRTGQRVGQYFGLEKIGFFEDQHDIEINSTQMFSKVYPGDLKYKDQNNDQRIDEYDLIPMGYSLLVPEINFAVSFEFEYKGIGINALFQGVANYTKFLDTRNLYMPLFKNSNISEHYYANRWIQGADNSAAIYPRLTTTESKNNYLNNSVFMADASYLKLRVADLYYRLPTRWINVFGLTELKVFARGMDLFSIDKIKITDPEDIGMRYPTLTSLSLGLNVKF